MQIVSLLAPIIWPFNMPPEVTEKFFFEWASSDGLESDAINEYILFFCFLRRSQFESCTFWLFRRYVIYESKICRWGLSGCVSVSLSSFPHLLAAERPAFTRRMHSLSLLPGPIPAADRWTFHYETFWNSRVFPFGKIRVFYS